jgi:hypothetical protein
MKSADTRFYATQENIQSSVWPDSTDFDELIQLIKTKGVTDSPAHQYGRQVLSDLNKIEEAKEFAEKNFVNIRIVRKYDNGDLFKFSLDYGIENFMADVGGILGIYLGASILTLGEFIEFLFALFVANFKFGRGKTEKVEDFDMKNTE